MTISKTFESEKNRKALTYTIIICAALLLMFILISWKVMPPTQPVVQDLIEINLGNESDGLGDVQPLIKGDRSPINQDASDLSKQAAPQEDVDEKVTPDEHADDNAAPVIKTEKKVVKTPPVVAPPKPVVTPAPKPASPKATYGGGTAKNGGNNPTEDNGYKYHGNNPNGGGDNGSQNGNKDSDGNTPGGKVGGNKIPPPRISRYYSFEGNLPKATIYAMVQVSNGKGTLLKLVKPSTSFDSKYVEAVRQYLRNMEFDKNQEGTTTIPFNFNVK